MHQSESCLDQIPTWLASHELELPDARLYLGKNWCDGRASGTVGELKAAHLVAQAFSKCASRYQGFEAYNGSFFHPFERRPQIPILNNKISIRAAAGNDYSMEITNRTQQHNWFYSAGQQNYIDAIVSGEDFCFCGNLAAVNHRQQTEYSDLLNSDLKGKWACIVSNCFDSVDYGFHGRKVDLEVLQRLSDLQVSGVMLVVGKIPGHIKKLRDEIANLPLPVIIIPLAALLEDLPPLFEIARPSTLDTSLATSSINNFCESLSIRAGQFALNSRNVVAKYIPEHLKSVQDLPYVLVTAHHDHLGLKQTSCFRNKPDSYSIFPGAVDNMSGVLAMLATIPKLVQTGHQFDSGLIFSTFSGEELGQLGAQAFCEQNEQLLKQLRAVVCLDSVGVRNPLLVSTPRAEFMLSLHKLMHRLITEEGLEWDEHKYFVRSDADVFLNRKIPTLLFTNGKFQSYHTPQDDGRDLDLRLLSHQANFFSSVIRDLVSPTSSIT